MRDTDAPDRRNRPRKPTAAAADERATTTPARPVPTVERYVETRADGASALRLVEADGTDGAWISAAMPSENLE